MPAKFSALDLLRRRLTANENHLVDGLLAGRVSRREFLRHGSLLGLSVPMMGGISAAVGLSVAPQRAFSQPAGGTVRYGQIVPGGTMNPLTVADAAGVTVMSQYGETLVLSDADLKIKPLLAESWKPNDDGTVWTFKLRQGVKFHNGEAMTADDVVATFDRLCDPANASNALSVFAGLLSKGGTRKVDEHTVEFHLEQANGNFPYAVSTDNYNAIIVPAAMPASGDETMIGTGPFRLETYTPKVGASFVRNPDYWGAPALPDRVEANFFDDYQPQIFALQAGQIDVIQQLPVLLSTGLINDPNAAILNTPSSIHHQVHMKVDRGLFKDKRVRRAIALCIDRPTLVNGLLQGRGQIGNDNPFMPTYPSTGQNVPQRQKNIAEAKQLMEAAGMSAGFEATLTTEKYLEIPEYAVLIQNAVKEINGNISLNIMDQGAYYGDSVPSKSPWLDCEMGITDYGHRGVPNVVLQASLSSTGTWNAASFKNAEYDTLVAGYVRALDLEAQREASGKIQSLLLDESPILFGYFQDMLSATSKTVSGVTLTAMGHLFLAQAKV
ncbi:ABC transporter substrate-binding protein [Rhizobium sp. KVB221]|uniref:ABC transporter substrate-binding protein n=1 Tax=Rhizobium setariae TaxID=2801340 RepID=A0A936YPF7_9HYPH|nr:ABC transporter substrate-binding protein [Rhizobium setariae]MBL0374275.1 ABC transporter substrate-binding protein [Rhizobium setariae]